MVFYRKYRPQTINDLDNEAVRQTLFSVLKNPTTHAFLFTGPKGLGKTSTARIIAKAVNCTGKKKDEVEPCNTCEQCVSITSGTNMDVLEIDAASNRGIDEIRDLKEKIRLAPVGASKKVYIIDEVHMLTTEAFNALLKTLEEPPSHAMFILCTTEPHKVPQTIMSRCSHISFTLATKDELVRSFRRIVAGEKLEIDDEALEMIAQLADGGFRDRAKVLEEVSTLANGAKITKELIEQRYKVASIINFINGLLKTLKAKEVKGGLEIVSQLVEQGVDTKYFIDQLIRTLHNLLLIQVKINGQQLTSAFSLDEIKELVEIFSKAYADIKYAVLPQLPLELAIIEYCGVHQREQQVESSTTFVKADEKGVTVSTLRKEVGDLKKKEALYGVPKQAPKEEVPEVNHTKVELMHASPNGEITKEWMDAFWKQMISEMKQYNHTIAGLLRGCSIRSFDKKSLIIQTNYKFHKERLDDMKTRGELIRIAKLLTGKDVEVNVELQKGGD